MPGPRCSALRGDGQPCGALATSPDATYCRHHERLAKVHGEDAVRQGRYPRKRDPQIETPVVVEIESNGGNGNVGPSPADVRPALAQAAASSLGEIQQALLDAAVEPRESTGQHFRAATAARRVVSLCRSQMSDPASPRSSFCSAKDSAVRPRPRNRHRAVARQRRGRQADVVEGPAGRVRTPVRRRNRDRHLG